MGAPYPRYHTSSPLRLRALMKRQTKPASQFLGRKTANRAQLPSARVGRHRAGTNHPQWVNSVRRGNSTTSHMLAYPSESRGKHLMPVCNSHWLSPTSSRSPKWFFLPSPPIQQSPPFSVSCPPSQPKTTRFFLSRSADCHGELPTANYSQGCSTCCRQCGQPPADSPGSAKTPWPPTDAPTP